MSSEKPKTQKEQELYEQIKKFLNIVFASYKEQKPHYQVAPLFSIENPYLEITASGHFSPTLKGVFSDKTLACMQAFKEKQKQTIKEMEAQGVTVSTDSIFDTYREKALREGKKNAN